MLSEEFYQLSKVKTEFIEQVRNRPIIAERKADFILVKDKRAINIEVNFYSGAGSKPEEIIDSYINRQVDLERNGIIFSLITDGKCWNNQDKNQLTKGFRHLNYLMNYNLAQNGMLQEMVDKVFG